MARTAGPADPYGRTRPHHYLEEIRRFPMLERQEEYMLAKRYAEHGDREAAHKHRVAAMRTPAPLQVRYLPTLSRGGRN